MATMRETYNVLLSAQKKRARGAPAYSIFVNRPVGRLLATLAPRLEEIRAEVAALAELRDKPAGTLRVTAGEHSAVSILQPALAKLLPDYPDVKIEVIVDNGLTDIAAEGYDAGIRLGDQVAKDMIALRIGPDMRMVVVGSPAYFARHPVPRVPQDLVAHNCINMQMPTSGGLFVWNFERAGREVNVRCEGQLVLNNLPMRLSSVLAGLGLAWLPEDQKTSNVATNSITPSAEVTFGSMFG